MGTELDPESPLGRKLTGLIGLNLYMLTTGVLRTCDPKHIFKRELSSLG